MCVCVCKRKSEERRVTNDTSKVHSLHCPHDSRPHLNDLWSHPVRSADDSVPLVHVIRQLTRHTKVSYGRGKGGEGRGVEGKGRGGEGRGGEGEGRGREGEGRRGREGGREERGGGVSISSSILKHAHNILRLLWGLTSVNISVSSSLFKILTLIWDLHMPTCLVH